MASPANAYRGRRPLAASMLIDGSGTETLFGDAQSYACSLQQALAAADYPAGVAIASNAEAALLLARVGKPPVCATAHTLGAKLAPLSIGLLPCGLKVASVLRGWGISTLGELAALPEAALISRLGEEGRRMQQLARGQAERLLSPNEPEIALWEAATLDTPVTLLDSLLFVLSPLLEAVMRRAVERACALRTVRLTLRLDRATPHMALVRPALPTQDRGLLLKLLRLELEAHPPSAPILEVTLEAEAALPPVVQRGLFQAQFPDPGKLDLLLARLRSIAGEGMLTGPAWAWQRIKLIPPRPPPSACAAQRGRCVCPAPTGDRPCSSGKERSCLSRRRRVRGGRAAPGGTSRPGTTSCGTWPRPSPRRFCGCATSAPRKPGLWWGFMTEYVELHARSAFSFLPFTRVTATDAAPPSRKPQG